MTRMRGLRLISRAAFSAAPADRNEWPEWGDWDFFAIQESRCILQTIEMNDPNEGIETVLLISFYTLLFIL